MEYKFLMDNAEKLCEVYDYETLFNKGKILPYKKRLNYSYKIRCILDNLEYKEVLALLKYEDDFLKTLINNNELDYLIKSIKDIVRYHKLNDIVLAYIKQNIDSIPNTILEEIILVIIKSLTESASIYSNYNIEPLRNLLLKAANEQELSILDLKYVGAGGFTKVYRLGEKAIKIGYTRRCTSIPDNRRLLIPDFKGYIEKEYVEVTDYLETTKDISEEEAYQVYKELRDMGIVWIDPYEHNLARVTEIVLNNIKERRKKGNIKGVIPNDNSSFWDELKVGDLVIIDLDHMFYENEPEIIEYEIEKLSEATKGRVEKFNNRYLREKNIQALSKKK